MIDLLQKMAKLFDSGSSAHEDLHSTGIADQIRFVLLGKPDLPCLRTYGTREHRLSVERWHCVSNLRIQPSRRQQAASRSVSDYKGILAVNLESDQSEPSLRIVAFRLIRGHLRKTFRKIEVA